ncbi:protein kinase [Variovorax robiniae]|uniref:non-specific serine/threonine protein kinase n=1 Tax=Variovorax robiniae TaxID=1836199 RepID=A0ABU8XHN8_9BURK
MKTPNLVHQHTVPIDAMSTKDDEGAVETGVGAVTDAAVAAVGTSTHSQAKPPGDDSGLREGTRLAGYEVIGVIGRGGFGIVYLAFDNLLERHVAIKEYLPASLGVRAPLSPYVTPRSHRTREAFGVGLRSFINEARLLARFNHPALVKVLRFWEANGTAYMAMPYCQGPTLADELAALGRSPDEEELRRLLRPLLDGLAAMHAVNCFHRDVAPDDILLTDDGPMLLDFGAARRVIGNLTNDLSAVVKPGFSPIEQYAEDPSLKQGPWTDLYALAAVAYAAVTGKPPQPAVDRVKDDRLKPLSEVARGRFSPALIAAIDSALAVRPADRPKSVADFLLKLDGEAVGNGPVEAPREARFQVAQSGTDGRTEPTFDFASYPAQESPELPAMAGVAPLAAEFAPTFEFADESSPRPATPPAGAGDAALAPEPALANTATPAIAQASLPAPAPASAPMPVSEFELGAGAMPEAAPEPETAPLGAIVAVDTGAAAATTLPSWAREKPARSRMPLHVLLGMSFVLVLAAIGYRLGSTTPPPMVSRLQPSTTTKSASASAPASAPAPAPASTATSAPTATVPPVPTPAVVSQATRTPAAPTAAPTSHAPASVTASAPATPAPASARSQAAAPPAASSAGHAQATASASAPPATAAKTSPDSAPSTTVALKHPTAPAPTPPASGDSHVKPPVVAAAPATSPRVETTPTTPSHAEAPAPPTRPEHLAQAAPARSAANRARCTEIIQSASLGPLNAGDTAFLKRECHR